MAEMMVEIKRIRRENVSDSTFMDMEAAKAVLEENNIKLPIADKATLDMVENNIGLAQIKEALVRIDFLT